MADNTVIPIANTSLSNTSLIEGLYTSLLYYYINAGPKKPILDNSF